MPLDTSISGGARRFRLAAMSMAGFLVSIPLGAAEDPALGGHAAAEEPFLSQTLWAIISFVVVLAVLLKYLIPPIVQAMDRRAADIRDALSAAEKARADAQVLIEKHHADLETARGEAAAIIEEGKADAVRVRESILAAAKKDAEEVSARVKRDIERAKDDALATLKKASVAMAIDIAGRLIEKNLNAAEHQDLIQERIRGITGRS